MTWVRTNFSRGERALDRGIGSAAHAQRESPPRAEVVLRLDRAEPPDDIAGPREAAARQPLVGETRMRDRLKGAPGAGIGGDCHPPVLGSALRIMI
jgi:hypothetical protein